MTNSAPTRTLVIEREMPHSPQKIWRALTEGPLIEQWLMKNDFEPVVNHRFNLRADWGFRRLSGPGNRGQIKRCLTRGPPMASTLSLPGS